MAELRTCSRCGEAKDPEDYSAKRLVAAADYVESRA